MAKSHSGSAPRFYSYNCVKNHNKVYICPLIMVISTISMMSVESVYKSIAQRVRTRRLEKNLTQKAFAKRAGVGYDAYRSFESTGDTSLRNLILIAFVLGDEDVFESIFTKKSYQSIDEIIRQKESKTRKRASSK